MYPFAPPNVDPIASAADAPNEWGGKGQADMTATLAAIAALDGGRSDQLRSALDQRMWVQFYWRAEYDKRRSEGWEEVVESLYGKPKVIQHPPDEGGAEEGIRRARYNQVTYVKIVSPGDASMVIDRAALPSDMLRWQKQYEAFMKKGDQDAASGTPLKLLTQTVPPILNEAQLEELAYFKIRTVEQLAALPDNVARSFHGAQDLKRKAVNYLEVMKAEAPRAELRSELEKRDNKIAELEAKLSSLIAANDNAEAKARAKKAG